MYYLVDEFLRLLHESERRGALRVHVLIRLKIREDEVVTFRRTRLRRCFQFYENRRSYGKASNNLLSQFEVFQLPIDDKQRPLQTVVLGGEVLQNLHDDNIH